MCGKVDPDALRVSGIDLVFCELRKLGICFGVIHGLENYPQSIGRDVDIFVKSDQVEKARLVIGQILQSDGWRVGVDMKPIGIDQVFGVKHVGARRVWIELDLIHHHPFCWRGLELVTSQITEEDIVGYHGYPLFAWGWFAKNLILQLLAGNEGKFRKNFEEYRDSPFCAEDFVESSTQLGLQKVVNMIDRYQADENLTELKKKVRTQVIFGRVTTDNVVSLGRSIWAWLARTKELYFPPTGSAPVVHLRAADPELLKNFSSDVVAEFEKEFLFPNYSMVVAGQQLQKGRNWYQRVRGYFNKNWEFVRKESNYLTLQLVLWGLDDDESLQSGDPVTPGDFIFSIGKAEVNREREELAKRLTDAFFQNLKPLAR